MYRNDYIMRMIRQAIEVMGEIAGLRKSHNNKEAKKLLEQTYAGMLGFNSKLLHSLPVEELLYMMKARGELEIGRAYTVALLLKEEAQLAEDEEQDELAERLYEKSLSILLEVYLLDGAAQFAELRQSVDDTERLLARSGMSAATLDKLWRYYEFENRFSDAEDVIFTLLETDIGFPELMEQGVHFYDRLRHKSDEELESGNLPREEVEESLRQWRNTFQSSAADSIE